MYKQKVKVKSTIQAYFKKIYVVLFMILIVSGSLYNATSSPLYERENWIGGVLKYTGSVHHNSVVGTASELLHSTFSGMSQGKKNTASASSKKSWVAEQFVRVISKITTSIIRSSERMHFIRSVRKNGRKILFLSICIVVIVTSLSFYRGRYEGKRFMTTTRLSIMDKEVQRACRYIEDHFDEPELGLASISSALVTGEAFLEALFEKELGLTLAAFVNQVRINRIKIMLRRTPGITAQTVALAAGYHDEKEMNEKFKEVSGFDFTTYGKSLSPSER